MTCAITPARCPSWAGGSNATKSIAAPLREAAEEVGSAASSMSSALAALIPPTNYLVFPIVAAAGARPRSCRRRRRGRRAGRGAVVGLADLAARGTAVRRGLDGRPRTVPALTIDGRVIWGRRRDDPRRAHGAPHRDAAAVLVTLAGRGTRIGAPHRLPKRPVSEGSMTPQRIAVLTSGGDAPGMNAASSPWRPCAFGGRAGHRRDRRACWCSRPGGRRHAPPGPALGRRRAARERGHVPRQRATGSVPGARDAAPGVAMLAEHGVDGLVVIGGNGSQAGAYALVMASVRVVGVASTIDNDLVGIDADRLRYRVVSVHRGDDRPAIAVAPRPRLPGRGWGDSGHIVLHAAKAGGAEAFAVPERPFDADGWLAELSAARRRKRHAIGVVAEGVRPGAVALADALRRERAVHDLAETRVRATVLGHQRGATPTASDRLLATRLGAEAVSAAWRPASTASSSAWTAATSWRRRSRRSSGASSPWTAISWRWRPRSTPDEGWRPRGRRGGGQGMDAATPLTPIGR
ncbi:MAG: 6-phosphofructokinase [Anaerolineae bacterium]